MKRLVHPDTLAATALGWIDRETDAMAAPLRPSTSFLRDPENLGRAGRIFTRDDNPSYLQPEAVINALEGGGGCLLFASGMAAITSVFHRLRPGDHVILPVRVYSGLRDWLTHHGREWGLEVSYLPDYQPGTLEAAIIPGKTRMVWLETPSNPTWVVTDIRDTAEIAHSAGAIVAIDSTVSTPILTQPIRHGADIVVHSGSKYLNGHGDMMAGAAIVAPGREDLLHDLQVLRNRYGTILGSFEAWLLLRGMRTLALRVRAASASALKIATFLEAHPAVARVLYPGLASHPGHAIAARQMQGGFGGMLSFQLKGGEPFAMAVARNVRVIRQAISFGSTETVIEHRAGMEGPDTPTPRDLLRLSVGIENIDDLISDLAQALELAGQEETKT